MLQLFFNAPTTNLYPASNSQQLLQHYQLASALIIVVSELTNIPSVREHIFICPILMFDSECSLCFVIFSFICLLQVPFEMSFILEHCVFTGFHCSIQISRTFSMPYEFTYKTSHLFYFGILLCRIQPKQKP